jgi:hypothetical protein
MAAKRAFDGTGPWKATVPTVVQQKDTFTLRSFFKNAKSNGPGEEVSKSSYPTQKDAEADLKIFQYAVHIDRAKNWGSRNASGRRSAPYEAGYAEFQSPTSRFVTLTLTLTLILTLT